MLHSSSTPRILGAAALAAAAFIASAGPLNPPAGPVAPTYKTLVEVEPRTVVNATNTPGDGFCIARITQPGSYYLASNLTGLAGKWGIIINATDVTLDLNGFAVEGIAGSNDGISISQSPRVRVINGVVRSWGGHGVSMLNASDGSYIFKDLRLYLNGGSGLFTRAGCIIADCTSYNNTVNGFQIGQSGTTNESVVTGCVAYLNNNAGFVLGAGLSMSDCTARANSRGGFLSNALFPIASSSLTRCQANSNFDGGFLLGAQVVLSECSSADSDGGVGYSVGDGSVLLDCGSRSNALGGYIVAVGSRLHRCLSTGDAFGATAAFAVDLGNSVSMENCVVSDCLADGIDTGRGCLIRGCTVNLTEASHRGIVLSSESGVIRNVIQCNSGGLGTVGISAGGNSNRIEANEIHRFTTGIQAVLGGNVIVRNSPRATTRFNVVAGNYLGTVATTEAALNAATNSNSNIGQ